MRLAAVSYYNTINKPLNSQHRHKPDVQETGLGFIGLTNSGEHAAIIASSLQSRIETTK